MAQDTPAPDSPPSGFRSSEWALVVGAVVANLVRWLVARGIADSHDSAAWNTVLLALLGMALAEAAVVWRYISARLHLKLSHLDSVTDPEPSHEPPPPPVPGPPRAS